MLQQKSKKIDANTNVVCVNYTDVIGNRKTYQHFSD